MPLRTYARVMVCLVAIGSTTARAKDRSPEPAGGAVFYLDGSGGGGLLSWAGGVRRGLNDAGYTGEFNDYTWQTGLGPGVDQLATTGYKRQRGRRLAERICQFIDHHPDQPVDLIGLSAGTAVAVFTLEAMPEGYQVDHVVLLSASVSADYDLSKALRHVRSRIYVFTSPRDAVLDLLVPLTGTADGKVTVSAAGVRGFRLPWGANQETRQLYAKARNIHWRSAFARSGNHGGHTGSAGTRFVRDYVAPLLLEQAPQILQAADETARSNMPAAATPGLQ